MNFHQLRVFYEAAKLQNFTQAASKLCVSQPAVTAQIKGLEEATELKLFKKRGPKLALSEAGVVLLQYAHKVFELEGEIETALAEMRQLKRGLLKVAATKTYARYVMPGVISRFRETHPEIKVILDEGSSRYVCRTLLEMDNELGVLGVSDGVEGLTFAPFREEEVCLFAAPGHPLTRRPDIAFEELADKLIVMREEGSTLHALVRQCFERRGLTPTVLLQTSNSDFIKEMVEKGEGVAFLVRAALEQEIEGRRLVVIPVRDQSLAIRVNSAYLSGSSLSPAAKAFLKILEDLST
ncbi:MAG: LysR substrate-binding domain-containing protein [Deferrisomatales bacterium]|nr:LysR substrate-binding domain-containing protein [Deferrisomatales bacterium]